MLRRPVVVRRGPGLLGTVARTAAIAGTATVTSNAITGHSQRKQQEAEAAQQAAAEQQQQIAALQQQQAAAPPPAAAPAPAPASADISGELQKLAALKDSGVLTDAEFAAAKAKLLG
jgi:hypothetical protein